MLFANSRSSQFRWPTPIYRKAANKSSLNLLAAAASHIVFSRSPDDYLPEIDGSQVYMVCDAGHIPQHMCSDLEDEGFHLSHTHQMQIYIYIYNIASFLTFPNLDKKNISPIFWSEMPRGTFWSSYWPCVKRGWFLFNYSNFSLTLIRWLAAIQRLFLEALLPGVAKHSYLSVTVNNVSIIYSDKRKKVFVTIGKGE